MNTSVKLYINDIPLEEKSHIKYLGIMLDTNLNWKSHVHYISKKVKRSIGILSKIRYHVNLDVLTNLYYALIYPFLVYGIVIWGNTYPTNIQPLFILQKRFVRIITFSKFDDHSSPLFKQTNILKLTDLITFHVSLFMFNSTIDYFLQFLIIILFQPAKYTTTAQDCLPSSLVHFREYELTTENLTSNSLVVKYGTHFRLISSYYPLGHSKPD